MKRVAKLLGQDHLSTTEFDRHARFTYKPVYNRFGSWQKALEAACLKSCEKVQRDRPLSAKQCVVELRRIAAVLSTDFLTQAEFDTHSSLTSYRVVRTFGSWLSALTAAGLKPSPNLRIPIPLKELANEFLQVVLKLNRIPSLTQLARRSSYAIGTYSKSRGGYRSFKRAAIHHLLTTNHPMDTTTKFLLENELVNLGDIPDIAGAVEPRPHRQGRTLNFRGFVYAPTNESDVVALFGAVAHDLGFEILASRSAFPDCKARRKIPSRREHFVDCLIEFEYSSSDFKTHGHPIDGCDLIVCWIHNWHDCPLEVLVLSEAIKELDGWR
jgi:hypothetical protein